MSPSNCGPILIDFSLLQWEYSLPEMSSRLNLELGRALAHAGPGNSPQAEQEPKSNDEFPKIQI